jgi:hypothetical protein
VNVLTSCSDQTFDELVLLAPPGSLIPESLSRKTIDYGKYLRWLSAAQRMRGRIYLEDGAYAGFATAISPAMSALTTWEFASRGWRSATSGDPP